MNDSTKTAPRKVSSKVKSDVEECKTEDIDDEIPSTGIPATRNLAGTKVTTNHSMKSKQGKIDKSGLEENDAKFGKKSSNEEEEEGPRKKNPDFADFEKTGRWGAVSKVEAIIVSFMVVLITIAVVVVVVVVSNDSNKDDATMTGVSNNTPVTQSVILKPDAQMKLIHSAMNAHPLTRDLWSEGDGMDNPYHKAADWVVKDDSVDAEKDIVPRFALAALYFVTGGNEWTNSKGWFTPIGVCDGWSGVICDSKGNIVEIELRGNNLTGEIPKILVLFNSLHSLWLDNNQLEGPLPVDVFRSMPNLKFLYAQYNNFSGPIPNDLLETDNLRKCSTSACFDSIVMLYGHRSHVQ